MFVDKVQVSVNAGDGGDGIVSFRHEIYIANGGPDGGNGGKGGDVIFVASNNQSTLAAFRYNKLIKAKNGRNGENAKKNGRSAKDLIVQLPVGTSVLNEDNQLIADLTVEGQEVIIAKGGKGGFGNAHFISSVRQAPKVAEKGEKGEKAEFVLELKIVADVGLVGLPNAGKSSLLSAISNAKPEIADYPFTTLIPHLGVVDIDKQSVLFADIPGLIEGASQGKGLGDEFLRHVSRCKVLVHLIDVNSSDIAKDYQTIRSELSAYSKELAKKPEVVALTKIETFDEELIKMQIEFSKPVINKKTNIYPISSYAKKGLDQLLFGVKSMINKEQTRLKKVIKKSADKLPVIKMPDTNDYWQVKKTKRAFVVTGPKIEKFAMRTNFDNAYGVQRLRDIMKKMGINHDLVRKGIMPGETIVIGEPTLGKIEY